MGAFEKGEELNGCDGIVENVFEGIINICMYVMFNLMNNTECVCYMLLKFGCLVCLFGGIIYGPTNRKNLKQMFSAAIVELQISSLGRKGWAKGNKHFSLGLEINISAVFSGKKQILLKLV